MWIVVGVGVGVSVFYCVFVVSCGCLSFVVVVRGVFVVVVRVGGVVIGLDPLRRTPLRRTKFRSFFPSPAGNFIHSSLSWGSSR